MINGYDNNKNDWHYVKISIIDADKGQYMWKNKAGINWTLTKKPNSPDKLIVGPDCPYFISGYTEATLKFDGHGKVISISGPWNEIYSKQPPKTPAKTDEKHGHGYENGPEHGSEIIRVDKITLMERRVTRLATRGAFVSFLMWAFVFIAATIGRRASW